MPNVTLHLVLADRVLEVWRSEPDSAPFSLSDPANLNAFYHGSFGPDLGYFPGGHPFFSDLAHTVRTGALARTLVSLARTEMERAFAWGWVTHVLGDVAIHPIVGYGVGDFLHGDRERFVSAAQHKTAHVQVEVGLDAHFSARDPELRARILSPVFDGRSIGFLAEAYRQTYGFAVDPELLLASHLTTQRMSLRALASIGVMGELLALPPRPTIWGSRWVLRRALDVVHGGFGRESMLLAYVNPLRPRSWLVEQVDEVVRGFPGEFSRIFKGGLADYPDYNLDTGLIERVPGHPVTLQTLATLGRLKTGGRARRSSNPWYRGAPARAG
jgi:hypothetical protein